MGECECGCGEDMDDAFSEALNILFFMMVTVSFAVSMWFYGAAVGGMREMWAYAVVGACLGSFASYAGGKSRALKEVWYDD